MSSDHATLVAKLVEIVGESNCKTDSETLKVYGVDWTYGYSSNASCVVFPNSSDEVATIVSACREARVPIVPSGGRTGLAAGACADNGEVVLSLEKMTKILDVDPVGLSITAEAGCTTQALQEEAAKHGLMFPLDLAAKGSCTIGGNMATNAGGVRFIRFGGARDIALGMEFVTADGTIVDQCTPLRKNNTGFDFKHLLIGSEGTLGIITKVSCKLIPLPSESSVALLATENTEKVLEILASCHKEKVTLGAFEFFSQLAHEKVLEAFPQIKSPFEEKHPYYILLEVESENSGAAKLEQLFEVLFENDLVSDGVIASSSSQSSELWGYRENITESLAALHAVRKNDVSVPINMLAEFCARCDDLVRDLQDIEVVLFGHIGDGNLHINYVGDKSWSAEELEQKARPVEEGVFDIVQSLRGSISAEHGIGMLKKKDLHYSRSDHELRLMREVKKVFDPSGLLNPGKLW